MDPNHVLLDHYVRSVAATREADGARNRMLREHFAARRRARWSAIVALVRGASRRVERPAVVEQACCA